MANDNYNDVFERLLGRMIKRIKNITADPLFSGSAILLIGSNIANVLNYVYHLMMGRLLGPTFYGELATIISVVGLLGIIPLSFNLVIVKYISSAKDGTLIKSFMSWLNKRIFLFSSAVVLIITFTSVPIATFLNIGNPLFIVISGLIFSLMAAIVSNRAILQGLLKFQQLSFTLISEGGLKLLLSVGLVLLGFSVGGAAVAFLITLAITWFLTGRFLGDYSVPGFTSGSFKDVKPLIVYSIPVVLYSISNTSFYSVDLILVKHFFSPLDAGLYAALSTLGKIIFFAAGPIAQVMFPIIARRRSKGERYGRILVYSIILSTFISFGILVIYWTLPSLIITILFGPSYLAVKTLLPVYGFYMVLFTLASLVVSFYLSIGKTKVVVLYFLSAIVQIIGIWIYHEDFLSVIKVSLTAVGVLTLFLAGYPFFTQLNEK